MTKKELLAEAEGLGLIDVSDRNTKAEIEAAIAAADGATPNRPASAAGTGPKAAVVPKQPSTYAGRYRIIHRVTMDGKRLGIGTAHTLSDVQAKPLALGGHIELIK